MMKLGHIGIALTIVVGSWNVFENIPIFSRLLALWRRIPTT